MSLILTDIAVRRQVLLERFKTAEFQNFLTVLNKIDAEIRRQLSGTNLTQFRRARLESQLASLRETMKGYYKEYIGQLNISMGKLAGDSGAFEAKTLKAFVPTADIATPAPNQLWSAATTNPLSMPGANGGSLLAPFMESWAEGDAEMISNAVRVGYSLGETNAQILARIRGDAALRYSDGVLATSRAHASTVTRTAIQHVANSARAEVWNQNADIIDEYQWVSTLDSRTTPLCRDRDGKRFPVGKGPLPPAHPNCRSTTVAVIKGDFGKFLDEEAERASANGPVPANESYYDWLKRQPAAFQDQALGPTRGKLFRDGGLSTDEFSKLQLGRNFEPMTLDAMRQVEPEAFARAGLSDAQFPTPAPSSSEKAFKPLTRQLAEDIDVAGNLTSSIPANLDPVENLYTLDAFGEYTGGGYRPMNDYLRTGKTGFEFDPRQDELYKAYTRLVADALDSGVLLQDLNLYRGLNAEKLFLQWEASLDDAARAALRAKQNDPDNLAYFLNTRPPQELVGMVFEDDAFMSFSYNPQVAKGFASKADANSGITVRLSARSGETGWLSVMEVNQGESEILRRGGRFRIVAWDEVDQVLIIEPVP